MTNQPLILVIDDEAQILRALNTILRAHNYRVLTARNGEEGLALAAARLPDLVVLDMNLPDMDGIQVCQRLREWSQVPILILSVREAERDKVEALNRGADDYLVKPFGVDELIARIRVALRHAAQAQGGAPGSIIKAGDLSIDLAGHIVLRAGEEIKLTATEFKLLAYLAANPGRVLTHQSILIHVWGLEYRENIEYLRVYIGQLRKKLETDPHEPSRIISEPGVGYRFFTND